jgi:5-methylcytosine-specific restriction endonuclease McrA
MKIDRQAVYDKFGGKCAYCGIHLEFKKMQVDHYWPQILAHQQPELDNNRFENLMPSCHKCNNHKHGMRPDFWRHEIERHSDMLQNNTQFQRALRFGQVAITKKPVAFFYETKREGTNDN